MEQSISGLGILCAKWNPLARQLRRAIKITIFLSIVITLHVDAHGYSQTITFSGKDVPLNQVFASIEQQTGLSFFFNYTLVKEAKPVTLDVKNEPLSELLNEVLSERDLDYYQSGKTIFIIQKKSATGKAGNSVDASDKYKQIDVKGKVINQQGDALSGASVSVKNGGKQTLANEKGLFELKSVSSNAILEVSYVGYQRKEVNLNGEESISVQLSPADNVLDETQVIAYGTTTQRQSIGNVTTIKADQIARQPVGNSLLALEGMVPGLFVTQTTGMPGTGVTVRIQGISSIGNGNDPLYVVDGVPYVSQMLTTTTGGSNGILGGSGASGGAPGGNGNPLSYLNPGDIESVDVLKDAGATAIYGSRAANGAILITTKKGKQGDSRVDISAQQGFGKVAEKLKLLNTPQFLNMRHEAIANEHLTTSATDYDINGTWDTTRSTDWQKVLLGRTAQYTDINGSVSGGNSNTKYLIGSTFHKEGTVFPANFSDQKVSLHFSINSVSNNQRLRLQMSGNYLTDNNYLPFYDLTVPALSLAPDAPKLFNADGSLNWMLNSSGSSTWTNPLAYAYNKYQNKTNNIIANGLIGYSLLPGLELRASLGYNRLETNEFEGFPMVGIAPELRPYSARVAYYTSSAITSWIIEPQANYKRVMGNGKIDVLAGFTIQQNNSNGQNLTGSGYSTDAVIPDIHSAATVGVLSSVLSVYKYNAGFGRINYNWGDRYILELSGRRDGSSRFGSQNQFHNFGSAGLAWIFTEEPLVKNHSSFLSFGKLKTSFGTTGNDQIGDYRFISLYNSVTTAIPYQNSTGLQPTGLPNPYLQWELTKKWQFGIDLGFFDNRALLTTTYQINRSSNELLAYQLPIFTGFSQFAQNFPATVQNTSMEVSLHTVNIKRKTFMWSTNLNFTLPRNKLVSFPGLSTSTYASTLIVGKPINIVKAYHSLGVNPITGAYQFSTSKGQPTTSPNPTTDRTTIITNGVREYGGMQNSVSYKGIQLDFLIQVVKQTGPRLDFFGNTASPSPPGYRYINQPLSVLSRWRQSGDLTAIQRFSSNRNLLSAYTYVQSSDAFYKDASFLRVKNISLSYQLPVSRLAKTGIKELRVYALGQNLFTWTHFTGLDPETLGTGLPPLRVVTFGMKVGL